MKTIKLLGICLTPEEQAEGLMFLEFIPENSGMLFAYDTPQFLSFWMANTFLPLQIAFVGTDARIAGIRSMQALSTRTIRSGVRCIAAIEVEDGTFERLGIGVGDLVEVDEENAKIIFRKSN